MLQAPFLAPQHELINVSLSRMHSLLPTTGIRHCSSLPLPYTLPAPLDHDATTLTLFAIDPRLCAALP